jgi:hypothetical protein
MVNRARPEITKMEMGCRTLIRPQNRMTVQIMSLKMTRKQRNKELKDLEICGEKN